MKKMNINNIHIDDVPNLVELYTEKHRYYHNLNHIRTMLGHAGMNEGIRQDQRHILEAAIWFHDAIYDPTAPSGKNEDDSIEHFIQSNTFKEMTVEDRNLVIDMIDATKNHAKGYKSFEENSVGKHFLDMDLWELIHPIEISKTIEIEMNVFKEYSFVPFKLYKETRLKILKKMKKELSLEVDDNINFLKFFRPKVGVYCGSFDPIHKGHFHIIERSDQIFDKTIVAMGVNPEKEPSFSFEDLQKSIPYHQSIQYSDFQYDLVKRLQEEGYHVTLVRGLRSSLDFSYERKNFLLNEMIGVKKDLGVDTIFLISDPEFEMYSSSDAKLLLNSSKREVGEEMLHNPQKEE